MVLNNHQITNVIVRMEASSSICDKKVLATHQFHHTDRQGDLFGLFNNKKFTYFLHAITLVGMEASLHDHDIFTTKVSKH